MYTEEQMSNIIIEHTKEIAGLWESTKSAHKRHDDIKDITSGIHNLGVISRQ